MRFERGKDPREVLEIGMEESLQKFLHNIHQLSDKRNHQLLFSVLFKKKEFVEYLIYKGAIPNQEMLRIAINRGSTEIIEILLRESPNLKKGLYYSKYKLKSLDEEIQKLIS
jgi:hypothetical protein